MVLWKARTIYKVIDGAIDAASALNVSRSQDVIAGAGTVVAQEGQALGNVSRVASAVPDVGQAALKGPLARQPVSQACLNCDQCSFRWHGHLLHL